MYRVLLVDDEPEIREGLQEVVDFAALGFEVVGEAGNGMDALRLAEETMPDLIITDIRMPLMDGLTMAAQLKVTMPTVQYVILSGYDEFEYARQAIEVTALRYLLKPISADEFVEVMRDIKKRMDEEFIRRRDLKRLQAHFVSSLPLLREQFLASLVAGESNAGTAFDTAARYDMQLKSPTYVLALMRLPAPARQEAEAFREAPELLTFAVQNIADEVIASQARHYTFRVEEMLAVLFLLDDPQAGMDTVVQAMEEVCFSIVHYLSAGVRIGISAACDALSLLPNALRQASAALHQAGLLEEHPIVCITDIVPEDEQVLVAEEYTLRGLGNALKMGDAEKAEAVVAQLLETCRDKQVSPGEYRAFLLEILMVFIRVGRDLQLPAQEDLEQGTLEEMMRYPPLPQANQLLSALCRRFATAVSQNRASSSRLLAQQAEEYLRENFAQEDLTIEKLCRHLHISTSYFSAIFKKETHKTFLQYLNELRMDQAMTLLATTDLRTSEIAGRVGIGDSSYFSYAFRRHFGLSPSQVRKQKEGTP